MKRKKYTLTKKEGKRLRRSSTNFTRKFNDIDEMKSCCRLKFYPNYKLYLFLGKTSDHYPYLTLYLAWILTPVVISPETRN